MERLSSNIFLQSDDRNGEAYQVLFSKFDGIRRRKRTILPQYCQITPYLLFKLPQKIEEIKLNLDYKLSAKIT